MNSTAHLFRHAATDEPARRGPSDAELISRMEENAVNLGPMQLASVEDPELHWKLESLLLPGETILAFCGRSGLGPRPLGEWDLERIGNFLALQMEQQKNQIVL